jgi:hypothetical protein
MINQLLNSVAEKKRVIFNLPPIRPCATRMPMPAPVRFERRAQKTNPNNNNNNNPVLIIPSLCNDEIKQQQLPSKKQKNMTHSS